MKFKTVHQNKKAALLTVALLGGVGGVAYSYGHKAGRVSQLNDIVSAYNKRMNISDDANSFGRVYLCQEIGGRHEDCKKLDSVPAP